MIKGSHLPFQTPTPEIAAAFIKRVKIDGWDVDRAMNEAETIGLRAPGLKEFALNYVSSTR